MPWRVSFVQTASRLFAKTRGILREKAVDRKQSSFCFVVFLALVVFLYELKVDTMYKFTCVYYLYS